MPIDGDVGTAGFSIRTAYYLARACQAWNRPSFDAAMVELGLAGVQRLEVDSHEAFVAAASDRTLVVFRGTNDALDWLTNVQIAQVDDERYPGRVHTGFRDALDLLWPGVQAALPASAAAPLFVAGHSLGGALATLAAHRLAREQRPVRSAYAYGSPRVGDYRFFTDYGASLYRFVNDRDVVPHLPLEQQLVGTLTEGFSVVRYKHVGGLKHLDRFHKLRDEASEWAAAKDAMLEALIGMTESVELDAVEDHGIDNYVAAIAANLP